ncbi:reverse transcriptase family protein [Agrobacterium tumefaciens]|uniref:reverse transcriptase family protein n=1 Tax=Agrobacterium tumefaciens TaxID=358 RepID=UPI002A15540F|nr:reverse transcriptase family protein [Agrobacterium tumefaciens]MDX8327345.1 reverse transcriptase family protein [Agrobacterium tumefaciens]
MGITDVQSVGFSILVSRSDIFMLRNGTSLSRRRLGGASCHYPPNGVKVMQSWSPQQYRYDGVQHGVSDETIESVIARVELIAAVNPSITPVLTLRHLSELCGVEYGFLRRIVSRSTVPYRVFSLRKRIPGRTRHRLICVPRKELKAAQDWIVRNILRHTKAHAASFAYHPKSRPEFGAQRHCGCDYLLKIDITDFFHSVSEGRIFRVFAELGFSELLAFELARLTTIIAQGTERPDWIAAARWPAIPAYQTSYEGFLPQGASTSPMLSNLAMLALDARIAGMASDAGLVYTRYADDLTFSGRKPHDLKSMKRFKRKVFDVLNEAGFRPNLRKTSIRGPGARRIVLGMLVDGPRPRLAKEFKDDLRKHLHYLRSKDYGPAKHAAANKTSISAMFHMVRGLIGWATRVEPQYGRSCLVEFRKVVWPPLIL